MVSLVLIDEHVMSMQKQGLDKGIIKALKAQYATYYLYTYFYQQSNKLNKNIFTEI